MFSLDVAVRLFRDLKKFEDNGIKSRMLISGWSVLSHLSYNF